MKKIFLCFAVAAMFGAKGSAQGYANFDNVGQYVFDILKNFDRLDKQEFASYWEKSVEIAQQLGEDVPEGWTDTMYDRLRDRSRQVGIKWSAVRFDRFEDVGMHESDDGGLTRTGLLYVSYEGSVYMIKIKALVYNGKYYLGMVKLRA